MPMMAITTSYSMSVNAARATVARGAEQRNIEVSPEGKPNARANSARASGRGAIYSAEPNVDVETYVRGGGTLGGESAERSVGEPMMTCPAKGSSRSNSAGGVRTVEDNSIQNCPMPRQPCEALPSTNTSLIEGAASSLAMSSVGCFEEQQARDVL